MFEHKDEKLISREQFSHRMLRTILLAFAVMAVSLAMGVAGYHFLENLPWVDALLNASMILGGMGPVDTLKTVPGKLFASFYALYSGLALIGLTGLLLAPVFHRILHAFHETRK